MSRYEISREAFLEIAKEAIGTELDANQLANLEISIQRMHPDAGFGGEQFALKLIKMLALSVFHYRERKKT